MTPKHAITAFTPRRRRRRASHVSCQTPASPPLLGEGIANSSHRVFFLTLVISFKGEQVFIFSPTKLPSFQQEVWVRPGKRVVPAGRPPCQQSTNVAATVRPRWRQLRGGRLEGRQRRQRRQRRLRHPAACSGAQRGPAGPVHPGLLRRPAWRRALAWLAPLGKRQPELGRSLQTDAVYFPLEICTF